MDDVPVQFPLSGLDASRAFARQAPETTAHAQNIRSYDRLEDRKRGGSRPGLTRWINGAMPGGVQGLGSVAATGEQFVIGYFPFEWPDFVLDPVNFGNVRSGGSGFPSIPGRVVPAITWSPSQTELYEDEAFGGAELNPVAKDPRDNSVVPGTFVFDPPSGTVFGHVDQRTVTATFTPDSPSFRTARKTNVFTRKLTPTKVVWAPPTTVKHDTVIDGSILNAVGQVKSDGSALPGTVTYDIWYFDPDTGAKVYLFAGATMHIVTVYYFLAHFTPDNRVRYKDSSQLSLIEATNKLTERRFFIGKRTVYGVELITRHTLRRFQSPPDYTTWCEFAAPGYDTWQLLRGVSTVPPFTNVASWTVVLSGTIAANGTLNGLPLTRDEPIGAAEIPFCLQWKKKSESYPDAPLFAPFAGGITSNGYWTNLGDDPPLDCSAGSQTNDPAGPGD
jgi:hypothetical protein